MTPFWRRSLSQRLLAGLIVVSFLYWVVFTVLTIQENMKEVNELNDIHLAHTALALLRLNNPTTAGSTVVTESDVSKTIDQLFSQWPDLPARVNDLLKSDPDDDGDDDNRLTPPPKTKQQKQPPPHDIAVHHATLPSEVDPSVVAAHILYGRSLRYQIWSTEGRLVFRSANAPETPITAQLGFSSSQDRQGKEWHHYSIWDRSHQIRAIVSEANDSRMQAVRSIELSYIFPIALGSPVLILLLWLSVKRGLRPLTNLGREINARESDNLAPLDEKDTPRELRPIVVAINDLLQRMAKTLERERQFNDNAAHELRTPLAAIQAHLYAARNSEVQAERQQSIEQAQNGVNRSIRLVNQMLTLARLEPSQTFPDLLPVNLGEMAQTVCAELAPLALQRGQTLELTTEPGLPPVMGNEDLLSRLLGNLIDNAIRYTPQDGHISVQVSQSETGLQMSVCDDGPGIAPAQCDSVFHRFFRLAEQIQPGTGLGLTICRSIAELHHAQILLCANPAGHGLNACVFFSSSQK